jgi:hypothetical protein
MGLLRKQFIFPWYLCCVVFMFVFMLFFTICLFMLRCFSYWSLDCWLNTLINNNWIDLKLNNKSLKTSYWTSDRSLHSLQVDARSVKATWVVHLNLWTLIFRTENKSRVLWHSVNSSTQTNMQGSSFLWQRTEQTFHLRTHPVSKLLIFYLFPITQFKDESIENCYVVPYHITWVLQKSC